MFAKLIALGSAGFLAAATLTAATSGHAFSRRIHSGVCATTDVNDELRTNAGLWNVDTANNLIAHCPVPSDTSLSAAAITTLNVHGRDNSTAESVTAAACYTEWDVSSGICGGATSSFASAATTGEYAISVATKFSAVPGFNSSDFVFVAVDLPDDGNPGRSSVRGIFVQD